MLLPAERFNLPPGPVGEAALAVIRPPGSFPLLFRSGGSWPGAEMMPRPLGAAIPVGLSDDCNWRKKKAKKKMNGVTQGLDATKHKTFRPAIIDLSPYLSGNPAGRIQFRNRAGQVPFFLHRVKCKVPVMIRRLHIDLLLSRLLRLSRGGAGRGWFLIRCCCSRSPAARRCCCGDGCSPLPRSSAWL